MRHRTAFVLTIGAILLVGAACSQQPPAAPAAEAPAVPSSQAVKPTTTPSTSAATNKPATGTPAATSNKVETITVNNGGFSPSSVTISRGTKVTFHNLGNRSAWPASSPHPTHTGYPGFDPKHGVAPGDSWSFTFTRAGTWGYHDHLYPLITGTIIVK